MSCSLFGCVLQRVWLCPAACLLVSCSVFGCVLQFVCLCPAACLLVSCSLFGCVLQFLWLCPAACLVVSYSLFACVLQRVWLCPTAYGELQQERREHDTLKDTWAVANDQFLESQRLLMMDMQRLESLLTPQQTQTLEGSAAASCNHACCERCVLAVF